MAVANFTMNAGDTKNIQVTVVDANGNPKDLTDSTIKWQMARHPNASVLISKDLNTGIGITDAANGVFSIIIEPEDTVNLGDRTYYHEAEVTLQDDTVATVMTGEITILRSLINP